MDHIYLPYITHYFILFPIDYWAYIYILFSSEEPLFIASSGPF